MDELARVAAASSEAVSTAVAGNPEVPAYFSTERNLREMTKPVNFVDER